MHQFLGFLAQISPRVAALHRLQLQVSQEKAPGLVTDVLTHLFGDDAPVYLSGQEIHGPTVRAFARAHPLPGHTPAVNEAFANHIEAFVDSLHVAVTGFQRVANIARLHRLNGAQLDAAVREGFRHLVAAAVLARTGDTAAVARAQRVARGQEFTPALLHIALGVALDGVAALPTPANSPMAVAPAA